MAPVGTRRLKHIETPVEIYEIAIPGKATPAPQPPEKHRMAVLPVENISFDPTNDYFADGTTEELISTLSRITYHRVIARTSMMRYKGPTKTVAEIAR
jgi:TolB-like protein